MGSPPPLVNQKLTTMQAPALPQNPRKRRFHEFAPNEPSQGHQQKRRVDDIAECLKFLDSNESVTLYKKRKNAKERPSCPIIIHRRNMSLDEHRRVIWLRFGSLESMEEQWHSSSQVFHITGVRPSAQYKIIKRWLEHASRYSPWSISEAGRRC